MATTHGSSTIQGTLDVSGLITQHGDALGTTQVLTEGVLLDNITAATNGFQQISPALRWSGQGYNPITLVSNSVDFRCYLYPTQVSGSPIPTLVFQSSVNGSLYQDRLRISNSGVEILDTLKIDTVTNSPSEDSLLVWRAADKILGFRSASTLTAASSLPVAKSVFVTASGSDSTGVRGRLDLPFATINAANTAAQPGDTVFVFPGVYEETSAITIKDGVNFEFLGKGSVRLNTGVLTSLFTDGGLTPTSNIVAPGWTFEARTNQNVFLLTGVSSITFLVDKMLSNAKPCIDSTNAIVNGVFNSAYTTGGSKTCIKQTHGVINLNGGSIENNGASVVDNSSLYLLGSVSGFIKVQRIESTGAISNDYSVLGGALQASSKVYIEADLIKSVFDWAIFPDGGGSAAQWYCKAKRIENTSDCTVVSGIGNFTVEGAEVVNNSVDSLIDGICHGEAGTLNLIGVRITRTQPAGNIGRDLLTTAGGKVNIIAVSYVEDRVTEETPGDINRLDGVFKSGVHNKSHTNLKTKISSAGTLTLDNTATTWVFSGTTAAWTLPAAASSTDRIFFLKNRGTGAITLGTTGALNELFTSALTNSATIAAGKELQVQSDGTYWLEVGASPTGTTAGGNQVLTVAASDTPGTLKSRADYVCDGTSDEVEINAALAIASVDLMPGTFSISPTTIIIPANRTLRGAGDSTIIRSNGTIGQTSPMITSSDTTNIIIRDFMIDGNAKTAGFGVRLQGVGTGEGETSTSGFLITNLFIKDVYQTGLEIQSCNNGLIHNCRSKSPHYDFIGLKERVGAVRGCVNIVVSNCVSENATAAVWAQFLEDSLITGNIVTGDYTNFNGQIGIQIESQCKNVIVANNVCTQNEENNIAVLDTCSNIKVIGNTCNGTNSSINLYVADSSDVTVEGNTVFNGGQEGIYSNGDRLTVHNNYVHSNGAQSNASFQGIFVTGSDGVISNNKVWRGIGANQQQYGVKVGASALRTLVTNNHLYQSGINDSILNQSTTTKLRDNVDNGGNCADGVTISAAGTLTLSQDSGLYIFTGTTATWTLPAASLRKGTVYTIKNRGSGSITLGTTGALNEIYTTSATNTYTITAGSTVVLYGDGTYFLI